MTMLIPFRRRAPGSSTVSPARNPSDLFDRVVRDFLGDSWLMAPGFASTEAGWLPPLELRDEEKELVVRAELPGVDAKEVEIELHDDVLVLQGKKDQKREEKGNGASWTERRYGEFRREIALPVAVAQDGVRASFDKGVLTVRLTKAKPAGGRKIPIEAT